MKSRPWIQSFGGIAVPLQNPQPEHIRIRDIAHALALFNRYTGHTYRPYSVAQHSVLVARRAGGWDGKNYARLPEARYGLLHDAAEAYVGDVSSPLKALLQPAYGKLEDAFAVAILLRFNVDLTPEIEAAVKRADLEMLAAEKRDLLGPEPEPWNLPYEAPAEHVDPLSWRSAEVEFLTTFRALFPECADA